MTIVELDGEYHASNAQAASDHKRQQYLESLGWRVLRFSNESVLQDVEGVAISIAKQMEVEPIFKGKQVIEGPAEKDFGPSP